MTVTVLCGSCSREVTMYPSQTRKYCSRSCYFVSKRIYLTGNDYRTAKRTAKRAFDAKHRVKWNAIDPKSVDSGKLCVSCRIEKDRHQFAYGKSNKDGLQAWCNECRHKYHVVDLRKQMLVNAKARSKRMGWFCNILLEDIFIPEYCPVLGMKLELESQNKKWSPSIDRINNNLGYVKGNIRVISYRANSLKSDATLDELESILTDVRNSTQRQ